MHKKRLDKLLNAVGIHYERRKRKKYDNGEEESEVIFSAKSTFIIGGSLLISIVTLLTGC